MKINEAKEKIYQALELLTALKSHTRIEDNSKQLLEGILDQFTPEVVHNLKIKLKATKKKHCRNALQRKRQKQLVAEMKSEREQRALQVEKWFIQQQEEQARLKTEESVKLQADSVLHEVTRRKVEARRILTLLPALAKLRAGRCQRDAAEGATPSVAVTQSFELALGHLKGLWEKQLEEYTTEETGLKVMLEAGSATRLGLAERKLDQVLHDWQMSMFGEDSAPEISWPQLLAIRQKWDQYAVAPDTLFSSKVPSGWLLPQSLSDSWKNAINLN